MFFKHTNACSNVSFCNSLHGSVDVTVHKAGEVQQAENIRPDRFRQMKIQTLDQNESMPE
jgi:hypothetical protein